MSEKFKMNDSNKIYTVANRLGLVNKVKGNNALTSSLTTQEYINQQLDVMQNLYEAKKPEQATADALVDAWIDAGIVTEVKPDSGLTNKSSSIRR